MTELDAQTQSWLHSLKLNKTLTSITDFENGYNFGTIFDKLQLSRGKKFKNSSDLGCIFQNYKNVRDLLLQNFNHDFPVNNIIYRTGDLLKVIRHETTKYIQQKKIMTMKAATSLSYMGDKTLIQPNEEKQFKNREKQITNSATLFNQTSKMPKKIQDIQRKLDKFREQKTRHELVALQQRKQEIEQYRKVVMNNRQYEINKIKKLHEDNKDKQKKVYDVWYKTQQIKKNRIEVDKNFDSFQRSKRDKLLQTLRKQQVDFISKGQEMFQLNCMRQGIQLQHDPDKPLKPEGEFNKIVVLERIKDNIIKNETDKKQRIKRENKKKIEADQAKKQSQILWGELNKIDDYSKKFSSHFELCEQTYKIEKRVEAQFEARKQKCKNKKFIDLPAYLDQEKRQQQFRQRKIQYLFNDVKWMEAKWKKNYEMAEQVVEALLQATIQGEQAFQKNQGFFYNEWKTIQNKFLNHQDTRKRKKKDTKLYMDYSAFYNNLKQYVNNQGAWRNFQLNEIQTQPVSNSLFAQTLENIISKVYPDKSPPQNQKIPLYMPLKIMINGPRLAGKSTHSAKLAQKYGVSIINPRQLIKQAIDLAKPPVQQDSKKGAKKDTKKAEEPTPQKLALKEFGIKLLQKINSAEEANSEQYILAIKFKISQLFKAKNNNQIIQQFKNYKQKQRLRHEQALKQFQQAQKKPKKDSKKGGAQTATQQPPKPNSCFYSTGFVIDDFPLDISSIKLLQRQLNSYISEEERINQEAVSVKKSISLIVSIPQPAKDMRLKEGSVDILLSVTADQQNLIKRKAGRKFDPQTKLIYHPTFNPPPDIKGFAEKLVQLPAPDDQQIKNSLSLFNENKDKIKDFYSVFGIEYKKINAYSQIQQNEQTVQQTFEQLTKLIQGILLAKYQQIQNKPIEQTTNNNNQSIKQNQNQNQNKNQSQQLKQQANENIQKSENVGQKQQKEQNFSQVIKNKLSQENCKFILEKIVGSIKKYEEAVKQTLYSLDTERNNFIQQLLTVQKKFTNLINRPDDKAGKILGFQQNYNKLLAEQGNVVKDAQASKHLIQRLNQLYDSLWDAIGSKKNQAVQERIKFKESNWLNTQAQKVVQVSKQLIQIQLNYLCETLFSILLILCKVQGKSSDYMTEYLSLGIAPELQPISSIQKDSNDLVTNKRLKYYIDQTNRCIESLTPWIQQKYKIMKISHHPVFDEIISAFLKYQLQNIRRKQISIANKISQRILEQRSYYQALLNKMDDWIIQGIKAQNDFVYEIFKNIKKCIQQARKSTVKELHVKQITQVLYPIRQLTLNPIPLRVRTRNKKIPIYSYMIFFEQIKTLTNYEGKINFDIFKKYMDKRKKSQLLDSQILKIDYDTMQQYLVKDGTLFLKQLAMAVILWDVNVFDDDQLAVYKSKLLKKQQTQQQRNYKFKNTFNENLEVQSQLQEQNIQSKRIGQQSLVKKKLSVISAFPIEHKIKLSQLILMEGAFDEQEQYIIKHFIFEIFRENGADYIEAQNLLDTLSFFDQIQVLTYGDTIMLRNF